ncbi:MAG: hypothetical protein HOD97_00980 [Candidatus Marinimicrobia bacterium]|jgi:hypothetical protein|nr:hypothetical protein [Candidatus Neomarinimicrobiota bacterium]MBT3618753.1 hypothetical protein [Candidatus Neomarinimicrobiota bacterium]MBT3828320.1 hypothetical protein [Candidatus Neomarinimicrobiota bacterium]MBT3997219.1 hypothetical protein [Candidatus Neomarinimicrobiota bacterium]MBT4280183.1 hypothetical protein [Candidatus Neomarinimicrobiota bacterium]
MINRKPFVGISAFLIVFLTMPIGHAVMILMENIFGENHQYNAAILLGLLGSVILFIGAKNEKENTGTWLGLFAGLFIWTGWVEFSFVFYANHLGVQPIIENGEIVTKPEYLILPSSIGVLLASLLYFFFNKETRCHFFRWFHRNFTMNIGKATPNKSRNFATITAMETIYVTWFFYIVLLLIYDNSIFGDRHWVTFSVFYGSIIWSMYLIIRLLKFQKIAPAIRYAIPTVIIFWNAIEILGRWNFFKEIWIHPGEYALEMGLIFSAFIVVTILTVMTPEGRKPIKV